LSINGQLCRAAVRSAMEKVIRISSHEVFVSSRKAQALRFENDAIQLST
jgi:hypothetical protein